jgi:hypothetical protein
LSGFFFGTKFLHVPIQSFFEKKTKNQSLKLDIFVFGAEPFGAFFSLGWKYPKSTKVVL